MVKVGGQFQEIDLGSNKWKTDTEWSPIISVAFQRILDILDREKKIEVTGLVDVQETEKEVCY